MQTPRGTIVTYTGKWQSVTSPVACVGTLGIYGCQRPSEIVGAVVQRLSGWGLTAVSTDYTSDLLSASFGVRLSLRVDGAGFASENDIISIVRGEVYNVAGASPLADSIIAIKLPQQQEVATGQPDNSSSGGGGGLDINIPSIDKVIQELSSNTQLVVVGLAIGLITAVLLIARPR